MHTIFIWSMYYLMVYICFFALDFTLGLSVSDGLFVVVTAAGLGMVVPTPGGIGAYHYLVMLGLGVLGIAKDDGVSFATWYTPVRLVMTIIAGVIGFGMLARARHRLKIQEADQSEGIAN
ncbi:MAG: lysylphosphatidylglycerol synthase domain-containing protein [Owenweeksia sp.]|nr:lysylphosphatidylglycerol synthase domain-containing protein [Owenweeksia sp.]